MKQKLLFKSFSSSISYQRSASLAEGFVSKAHTSRRWRKLRDSDGSMESSVWLRQSGKRRKLGNWTSSGRPVQIEREEERKKGKGGGGLKLQEKVTIRHWVSCHCEGEVRTRTWLGGSSRLILTPSNWSHLPI